MKSCTNFATGLQPNVVRAYRDATAPRPEFFQWVDNKTKTKQHQPPYLVPAALGGVAPKPPIVF